MNEKNMIEAEPLSEENHKKFDLNNENVSIVDGNGKTIIKKDNKLTSLSRKTLGLLSVIFEIIAAIFIFGMASLYVLTWLGMPEIASALIASQLSVLILGLAFYDFKLKRMFSEFKKKINGEIVFQALKVTMFVLMINTTLGFFMKDNDEISGTVDNLVNDVSFFMSIFLPVVIAPLFEELAFRGGLKYVLIGKYGFSKVAYVIIGGVIFGLMHYSPGPFGIIHVVLTGTMGMIYSIYYLKTDNIYVPMISHLLYNGLIMLVAHIA